MRRAREGWTTSEEIVDEVYRLWDRGHILSARLDGSPLFPLRLRFRKPTTAELADRFDDVRKWIRDLVKYSRDVRGSGYAIEWVDVTHRELGRNKVPRAIVIETEADAIALTGYGRDVSRFDQLVSVTRERAPDLLSWVTRKPLVALSHADDWNRLVDVVTWLRANPRSGLYARQLDIAGVDSKFIEERRGILSELLDAVAPEAWAAGTAAGAEQFERRYGLRSKPAMVRFRILDPALRLGGISDLTIPAGEFAQLSLAVDRVFVTENEINGLAFPEVPRAIVIFGLGYGVDLLRDSLWLGRTELFYWGDIDTHGFAILDRLRGHFPQARSMLMDRATLLAHRAQWVREREPVSRSLSRLTSDESGLYQGLVGHEFGDHVRLEQERIGFGWVERSLVEALNHRPN